MSMASAIANGNLATTTTMAFAAAGGFTKAAAAEMKIRVINALSRWTTISDIELTKELNLLQGRHVSEGERENSRLLLVTFLDTPGGIQIQTIHSFCQSLLCRFPIEGNVPITFNPYFFITG